MAELLVFPALIAYGEAAVAYAGDLRGPGTAGRLATWGVRIGWLVQTALLVVQASRSDGFPWGTWAGALNLFVWLVVGTYLIWGCRPGYRLLGLGVMPPAVALLALAWVGGGAEIGGGDDAGFPLALHVGLMLAAFAGFTLAAGLAALYLWEERRLKRRDATVLRRRMPPLEALDRSRRERLQSRWASCPPASSRAWRRSTGPEWMSRWSCRSVIWAVFAAVLVLRLGCGPARSASRAARDRGLRPRRRRAPSHPFRLVTVLTAVLP